MTFYKSPAVRQAMTPSFHWVTTVSGMPVPVVVLTWRDRCCARTACPEQVKTCGTWTTPLWALFVTLLLRHMARWSSATGTAHDVAPSVVSLGMVPWPVCSLITSIWLSWLVMNVGCIK